VVLEAVLVPEVDVVASLVSQHRAHNQVQLRSNSIWRPVANAMPKIVDALRRCD
jgi:hypothetical protein